MASLKDLRNRIASVKATRKITQAMQMVAAAKLRRAQEAATSARPYAERMNGVMSNLKRGMSDDSGGPALLTGTGKSDVHLLIVMTAERGLCGGFNSNIARLARADVIRLREAGKAVKILCVGSKGADILKREFESLMLETVDFKAVKQMSFAEAEMVASQVLSSFDGGDFDVCTMYFSEFKSVINQVPTALQLIPAKFEESEDGAESPKAGGAAIYEYEPSQEEVLGFLLERNIGAQIFRGLLENAASEQGARMSAMDNATRNAGEMIDKLTISYNRQRQAQITNELIEIISGAEAL